MRRVGLALGLAIVAGCSAPSIEKPPAAQPIPFAFDQKGVQVLDRSQRIDFGRTDHSAIPAMTKLVGQAPVRQVACAGGGEIVVWPNGDALIMKRGAFRGWVSAKLGTGAGATCDPSREA